MNKSLPVTEKEMLNIFLFDTLDSLYTNLKINRIECKLKFSEASVHDYRVSMRRLMAMIDLLYMVFPRKYFLQAKKILKKQMKVFNPLRDNQVQIVNLRKLIYTYPTLFSYYVKQLHDEQFYINEAKASLEELSIDELDGLMFFIKIDLKEIVRKEQTGFEPFFEAAGRSFRNLVEIGNLTDKNSLDSVHKLRIAFKKYRYVIETLAPYILYPKDAIKKLKQIQNLLGEIQDNRVFLSELTTFIAEFEQELMHFYQKPIEDMLSARNKMLNELTSIIKKSDLLWNEDFFRLNSKYKNKLQVQKLF